MDLLRRSWSRPPDPVTSPRRSTYRRILASIYHRPTSWFSHGLPRESHEPSLGGVRSFSDEPIPPGRVLEMDVFLPGDGIVAALVEVEWCDLLPRGGAAVYDVGLRWVQLARSDLALLEPVLADS